jgi:hypothetical protein
MATLIASGATTGDAAEHTGPCTVWVTGDMKGGRIDLLGGAATDRLAPTGRVSQISQPGSYIVDAIGTYYLKATLHNGGSSPTCIVETTQ